MREEVVRDVEREREKKKKETKSAKKWSFLFGLSCQLERVTQIG